MNGSEVPALARESLILSAADLAHLEALCDSGRFLDAQAAADALGPLTRWHGPQALSLACRLARHLGARRLSAILAWRAWRADRQSYAGTLVQARELLSRRGQFHVWRWVQRRPALHGSPEEQAEWLAFQGFLASQLRDFEQAHAFIDQALACNPGQAWLSLEHSYVLEAEDRVAEALAVCLQVLERQPDYRAAQQQSAALEMMLGQDAVALARLREAARHMQSASLLAQLGEWLIDQGELDEAQACLERAQACSPRMDPSLGQWYAGRLCDIACLRGDYVTAHSLAEQAGPGFFAKVAERLASPQGERRLLSVPFVRQHHMTCGPATLTALARFWERGVEHLQVAEEICYDGTPHYAERNWAERNGWLVREFTVDWASAVALIDRGIPFTLTTQTTGSGHLQALVGYDAARGTLLLREPSMRTHQEMLAEPFFAERRAFGPRGMLMLPPEQAQRLDGLELPESAQWDAYHAVMKALYQHRREDAQAGLAQLREQWPGQRLTLQAERALAGYDGNESARLSLTEKLLALFPEDAGLQLAKAASLAQIGTRAEQQAWFEAIDAAQGDVWVVGRYAQFLADDGSRKAEAERLYERVLRWHSTLASAWHGLASLLWDEVRLPEANRLYRIAACLDAFNEYYASGYFRASRWVGEVERGLDFMRRRAQALGALDGSPVVSLCQVLEELERIPEQFEALEQGLQRRPDDPELLLYASDAYGRYARTDEAEVCLQRAEPLSQRGRWVRAQAWHLMRTDGDLDLALRQVREVLEQEPLNMSLQRLHADLLQQRQGREAVQAHLAAMVERFPHHYGLAEMRINWLRGEALELREQALRHLLLINPAYPWALRELAVNLANQARGDEALEQVQRALSHEPQSSSGMSCLAFVQLRRGEHDEAVVSLQRAIERSVDNEYALDTLVEIARNREEALAALEFIHAELVRQVTFGDGLMSYQRLGRAWVEGEVLLQNLQTALTERPDLWQAWIAVAAQQRAMGQTDAAETLLSAATERFPSLPRLYLELALVHHQAGAFGQCREVLEKSFAINPAWTRTVRLYAESLLDEGAEDLTPGLAVIERALGREPEDVELRVFHAFLLGRLGRDEEQRSALERALLRAPEDGWAWRQLHELAERLEQPELPAQLAQHLVEQRPGDPDAWQRLAEYSQGEQREHALLQALRLAPFGEPAGEAWLKWLIEQGRAEEVGTWLDGPPWNGHAPAALELQRALASRHLGESARAVAELRAMLEVHGNDFDGWRQLADFHDEDGDYPAYEVAARQMRLLRPKLPISHGFLGHACMLQEKNVEAEAAFAEAAALDDDYGFAWFNLFDLRLKLALLDEALAQLPVMREHFAGIALDLRKVRLGVARVPADEALAREGFQGLVVADGTVSDALNEAEEAIAGVLNEKARLQLIEDELRKGDANPAAAFTWLRQQSRPLAAFKRLQSFDKGHHLACGIFRLMAQRKGDTQGLLKLCKLAREAIRADSRVWGQASYALASHGRWRDIRTLMADWRGREDAPSWALDNLALALREQGVAGEAAEVSQRALALDADNADARLWLALDRALAGDLDAVRQVLPQIPAQNLQDYFGCLRALLEAYVQGREQGHVRYALPALREAARLAGKSTSPVYRNARRQVLLQLAPGLGGLAWRLRLR
ncbi:MAG: Beta-barrel assembly-enhancing protease [Stenotrophomonas maltophilia]|nr:MAG: Beta-barrel assembly-enhancing protease [Stenotrophomonas maltophilia]